MSDGRLSIDLIRAATEAMLAGPGARHSRPFLILTAAQRKQCAAAYGQGELEAEAERMGIDLIDAIEPEALP